MKPVTLNLASRPFRNNLLVGTALGVAGAALVVATISNLYIFLSYGSSYAELKQEQAKDRERIAALQVQERKMADEVRSRNYKKAFEEGKVASELILRASFSWTQLFNKLETLVPPDVVMTAIRPSITNEGIVIRIEGVAKSHSALLSFEQKLLGSPAFAKVFPASERLLNPSLPDITFLLTCDYLPHRPVEPDKVAAQTGEAAGAPAPGTAPPEAAQDAAAGATSGVTEAPSRAHGASAAPAAAILGRGARPRDARAASQPIIAPGALYLPPAEASRSSLGKEDKGKKPAAASVRIAQAPAAPTPAAATKAEVKPPAGAIDPGEIDSLRPVKDGAKPAASTGRAAPPNLRSGPMPFDPNVPRTMPKPMKDAVEAQARAEKAPVPARRLDVPLGFVSRPVEEVYARLSEAHGVRFDLDDTVDRQAAVTINLQGRKLEDAILLIAGTARHRIKRVADGIYRVSSNDGGRVIQERPIQEEPLAPGGSR